MFEPNGKIYLYLYPIISSIFAGFVFWLIFSFFPDQKKKRSFSLGITNDLLKINNLLFHYFDLFMKSQEKSPSSFQNKIHACNLTYEDFDIALQNKILNEKYNYYPEITSRMICVGTDIANCQLNINEVIKRLYSFNLYLSANEIQILRNIQEKIFRYDVAMEPETKIGTMTFRQVNTSLHYMFKVLLELESDYIKLRKIVFSKKIIERGFLISKIQRLFYSNNYKKCIKECNNWIKHFPFDCDLQLSYKIQSLFKLGQNNIAYEQLEIFLTNNADVVSNRYFFYPLLLDSTAYKIILKKVSKDKIVELKRVVENESLADKEYLAANTQLKQYFSSKKG